MGIVLACYSFKICNICELVFFRTLIIAEKTMAASKNEEQIGCWLFNN